MNRTLISVFHLWINWAKKGRGAGIEHFVVAVQAGLFTFLNINTFQLIFGLKPFLNYDNGKVIFLIYIVVVFLFFKTFLPKSFLLNQKFSPKELKSAKSILIAYFILSILALILTMILFRK